MGTTTVQNHSLPSLQSVRCRSGSSTNLEIAIQVARLKMKPVNKARYLAMLPSTCRSPTQNRSIADKSSYYHVRPTSAC